ncbi:hypothetical protein [Parasitella parasitica]|uniref:Uncharacterized protein n=1 Tax=Parasitella parasitica TaxID=35722 RepID=A0A0B7NNL9_9FUNG|nr:hypothetical protein [Parasitella parasitica]
MRIKTRQIDSFTPGGTNINAAASLQKPQGRHRAEKHTESNKKRYMDALKRHLRVSPPKHCTSHQSHHHRQQA